MDDPVERGGSVERAGTQESWGDISAQTLHPLPYLSCYRERTMTTYYATPRSFFIIIVGHRPVSNERRLRLRLRLSFVITNWSLRFGPNLNLI